MEGVNQKAGRAAAWMSFLGLGVLGVRLILRDRVPVFSTLTYAAPPLVLALGAVATGAVWALARRPRRAAFAWLAAAVLAAWQIGVSRFDRPSADGSLRFLVWNVARGKKGWDRVAQDLVAQDAQGVVLVEARDAAPHMPAGWTWSWAPGGLGVGVKGRVLGSESFDLGGGSRAALFRVEFPGRPLKLLVVDIAAAPLRPRGPAFAVLEELMQRTGPDLVAGDFNTPRDSVHFDSWRGAWRHGFEVAGQGWDLTFPSIFPLLSIDHAWCGPAVVPVSCRHIGGLASDHRAVQIDLR